MSPLQNRLKSYCTNAPGNSRAPKQCDRFLKWPSGTISPFLYRCDLCTCVCSLCYGSGIRAENLLCPLCYEQHGNYCPCRSRGEHIFEKITYFAVCARLSIQVERIFRCVCFLPHNCFNHKNQLRALFCRSIVLPRDCFNHKISYALARFTAVHPRRVFCFLTLFCNICAVACVCNDARNIFEL